MLITGIIELNLAFIWPDDLFLLVRNCGGVPVLGWSPEWSSEAGCKGQPTSGASSADWHLGASTCQEQKSGQV